MPPGGPSARRPGGGRELPLDPFERGLAEPGRALRALAELRRPFPPAAGAIAVAARDGPADEPPVAGGRPASAGAMILFPRVTPAGCVVHDEAAAVRCRRATSTKTGMAASAQMTENATMAESETS